MLKRILFLAAIIAGPLFPVWAVNNYMVENTPGTSPTGQTCYDFQTTPNCSAFIAGISSGSLPSGSTFYIQNSAAPTTATQIFSVSSGTFTTAIVQSGTGGTSGQVLTSNGAGIAPTWQTGTNLLPSTNTWTGGNTFKAQVTISSNMIDGSGSQGVAGSSIWESQGGSAPTWTQALSSVTILAQNGNVAAPSIAFQAASQCGLYMFSGSGGVIGNLVMNCGNGTSQAVGISTRSAVQVFGTSVGDDANAGYVGQYFSQYTANQPAGATGVRVGISTITLSAGDWDVTGNAIMTAGAGTFTAPNEIILSAFPGNTATDEVAGDNASYFVVNNAVNASYGGNVPEWRVSIVAPTTIYLKALLTYSLGTPTLSGRISARRRR